MKDLQGIKHRINSVSQTRQITNAMETISIAKMRKAMTKYESNRLFFDKVYEIINDIVLRSGDISNEYFKKINEDSKVAYIVIASDKGLAGGYNSNVLKFAWNEIKRCKNANVFSVGQTTSDFFQKKNVIVDIEFDSASFDPDKRTAAEIAESLLLLYKKKEIDAINIIYTKMLDSNSMQPDMLKILPFSADAALESLQNISPKKEFSLREVEFDPSAEEVLEVLVEKYLKWVIYGALIQASASEHSSRRFAMSNATKNASEILDDLKIYYNQARQEAVTNELSEIITSSMGVKND